MSKRRMAAVVLVTAVLIICQIFPVKAADDENLYALSAVLMDGENGRVLYGKEAYKGRPNASTTKVMTCILALELAKGDDYVQVSENAASQPQTRLGMREGQQFYLEDLLYSLMLKSHNDSAVAIAEHIGGSVEGFAEKMNEKAKELGCKDTHFVTPNGLDGEDEGGIHHTTARDLALIMAYAIKNATFVHITQTRDYTFTDISGKKHYSVHNTNAFLDMETGVISGKTGFTGNAGYCYVCAVRQDERLFIVALLGCGWPGNKNYKWSDTKKLLSYGRENYQYVMLPELPQLPEIPVTEAAPGKEDPYPQKSDRSGYPPKQVMLKIHAVLSEKDREKRYLLKKTETITWETELPDKLPAPIQKNQKISTLHAKLNGKELLSCLVTADDKIDRITYKWYVDKVFKDYFH
ncbi:D-alanyl-D-alanine carboxypeptidase family protein [Blautia massiliensis (ex Durand et al. 2017)]|uniref:D-alanyl-D-alanine carboxypeptidase family protein n=1 Tax=Blautia massiliensis (ex Durand et al. 2017) TaxID=1737424 RepID=UPI001FC85F70|nr:D-alanyl-D-alanine carboxypeptidase family protein [Blautia massiliensis (ex Durand et al. 2017)]